MPSSKPKKGDKNKRWIFSNNATLINLPKISLPAAGRPSVQGDDNISMEDFPGTNREANGQRKRKPTVMELMKTHFEANRNILIPSALIRSTAQATDHAHEKKKTNKEVPANSNDPGPSGSGEYDNIGYERTVYSDAIVGANSFEAIRARFDQDKKTDQNKTIASSMSTIPAKYSTDKTQAEVYVIPDQANAPVSDTNTVPKYQKRKLPPTPKDNLLFDGQQGGTVEQIIHSLERR